MDIPLHARVDCADGECGESTYVIVDPTTHRVTDFVVQAGGFPNQEWLVPLDMVVQTEQDRIVIRVDGKDLPNLKPFTVSEFLPGSEPIDPYPTGGYMVWPSMAPETSIEVETQQIPPNTVAIPHGAEVKATDGDVGKVDEFLIDPLSNKITHMVIHEGVLWNKREVTIPVEEIDRITENTVFLKVDKYTVEHLPDRKA